ncbi:hypothetical protein EROM_020040 [Encephalitozoon romaleae SJ-2008]|uniref:Uncharacterized protein n=1 Tax=Encephalitozoon romaleae (strain SJ-2008) TaxID=1178016 RepID=I7ALD4_ENCRO|nr:hypothetical protein EROM_020040 [Encephalitozoon romaleae SJ-2008]AFN82479.1 hypothetical protein EROM_020040 [Encephalitozoon romaleae SJ-2008]
MDLGRYLGSVLENTERTLKVARLEKEIENRCRVQRDLIFSQRHIDYQMKNKEMKARMELEICKILRKFHEWILKQNLRYTKAISSKTQDSGDRVGSKGKGSNESMEIVYCKDQISTLLSHLYNNVNMGVRLLNFQKACEYSNRVKNIRSDVMYLINKLGLNILKGIEKVIRDYNNSMNEKEDIILECEDLKIKSLLGQLRQKVNEYEEIIREEAISRVLAVLSQGSVENDIRFAKLIDETLERTEGYESPEITRMSVQFIIAKKYVEDVVSLKEQPFLRRYLERNTRPKEQRL